MPGIAATSKELIIKVPQISGALGLPIYLTQPITFGLRGLSVPVIG